MTFNVRMATPADGENRWEKRRASAAAMIAATDPDVIGTQELFQAQGRDLVARLPAYGWIGRDRRGGHADEHMGIFYRRDRLALIRTGDFWLSETPDVPGSISWDHPFPRMATWAVFETIAGKQRFLAVNTHFPYRPQDEAAREKGAAVLLQRIEPLAAGLPVVLTGDFNTAPDSPSHRALTAAMTDAWAAAPQRVGPAGTYHSFTSKPERRIDWVLLRGFRPQRVQTVIQRAQARPVSDHFPVLATLGWPEAAAKTAGGSDC